MMKRAARFFSIFILVTILEGILVGVVLLSIPGDPKNAVFLGYSTNRMILIGFVGVVLFSLAILYWKSHFRNRLVNGIQNSSRLSRIMKFIGCISLLLFWITVWTPSYRLKELTAIFTRVQPLIIWVEIIVIQLALLVLIIRGEIRIGLALSSLLKDKRSLTIWFGLLVLFILIYLLLALSDHEFTGNQLYFPPGAPLTALQVVLAWIVFFSLSISRVGGEQFSTHKRKLIPILFLMIWIITFFIWRSVPMICTDDRPGPFPPNFICYPNVNDAVYSIGSHYITLGQGVYNHWLTDKPLYMAFLALGQGIAGENIEDYLTFQLVMVSLLPALLFLLGRKILGTPFGLLLAMLSAVQGYYSILLYRQVGSVNVKLENPEVLTALVLLLCAYPVFNWLRHPSNVKWAVASGGMISLATLIRFNPFFIAPFFVTIMIISNIRGIKKLLPALIFFIFAFTLVFSPWFFSAADKNGRNYYLAKINEVISNRFTNNVIQPTSVPDNADMGKSNSKKEPAPPIVHSGVLSYSLEHIDKAGAEGIFYHFLNNVFTGLAKLPTNLVFRPIRDEVDGNIWEYAIARPLWKARLDLESLLGLSISLGFVLAGILTAWRLFGLAGFTGAIIQLGYYIGNALSQTSGGRYLEPVNWVTLIYYCLGIYALTNKTIKTLGFRDDSFAQRTLEGTRIDSTSYARVNKNRKSTIGILMGACLLLGLILPALNLLPSRLPEETDPNSVKVAEEIVVGKELVGTSQWERFLLDRGRVVVEGVAYHPRYYRSDFYRVGDSSFELTMLAKEHVYIGYSSRMVPENELEAGRRVILLGCQLGQDTLWSADREIVELIGVIDVDSNNIYLLDPESTWTCTQ